MTDKEHLKSLTKGQKRYLSRFECAWCNQPLDRSGCIAIYEPCSEEKRIQRREDCLKKYKPRKGHQAK